MKWKRRVLLIVLLSFASFLDCSVGAKGAEINNKKELGFSLQFARSIQLKDTGKEGTTYCYATLRGSLPLTRFSAIPWHEHLRFLIEPNGGYFHSGSKGFVGGLNLGVKGHFLTRGRILPFLSLGAGALYSDFEDLSSKFNFALMAGAGFDLFLTKRLAIQFEYRLHHISNGGIRAPNIGINSNFGSVGLSWYI